MSTKVKKASKPRVKVPPKKKSSELSTYEIKLVGGISLPDYKLKDGEKLVIVKLAPHKGI